MTSESTYQPYRYAGRGWWTGAYTVGGGNPDSANPLPEAGVEDYLAVKFYRSEQAKPYTGGQLTEEQMGDISLPPEVANWFAGQPELLKAVEVFNRWAQDMTAWAKAVREDILRIEGHVGLAQGDPGDPPPVPWK